jgi:hypothetical protein
VYRLITYPGFESPSLRQDTNENRPLGPVFISARHNRPIRKTVVLRTMANSENVGHFNKIASEAFATLYESFPIPLGYSYLYAPPHFAGTGG